MPRQAIRQATCTECDDDEDNFTVTNTTMEFSVDAVKYDVRCQCGENGTVVTDGDGSFTNESVSHESASWNEDDEDDEDDEEEEE